MTGIRTRCFAGLVAALAGVFAAQGATAWEMTVNGTANADDQANAVATDGAEDVIGVGTASNSGSGADLIACKLAATDGATLWCNSFDGGASDEGRGVAVVPTASPPEDVAASGRLGADFAVLRLSGSDGSLVWDSTQAVGGTAGLAGSALAVAADPNGEIFAAGRIAGAGDDLAVCRLSPTTGAVVWCRQINGSGTSQDEAVALALDPSGDPVAVGTSDLGGLPSLTVVKLARATGADVWSYRTSGEGRALAIDASGDVFAVGRSGGDFTVIKLDGASPGPAAVELWRTNFPGAVAGEGRAVAVDSLGNPVAGGQSGGVFALLKLSGATGAVTWTFSSGTGSARAVGVDAANDVIAAGGRNVSLQGENVAVTRRNGATGARRWTGALTVDATGYVLLDGGVGGADTALAGAVDPSGNAIAAGYTVQGAATGTDFLLVKRSGTTGGSFPCGDGLVDSGEECDAGASNSDSTAGAGTCRTICRFAFCGDGVVDPGTGMCDLGSGFCLTGDTGEACASNAQCDEECDNRAANSDTQPGACRTTCRNAFCGDAVVDPGEQCDVGAESATCDGPGAPMSQRCTPAACGDGYRNSLALEACDDANTNTCDLCSFPGCQVKALDCGDGVVNPACAGERCDDGNVDDEDGCTTACQLESARGFKCQSAIGLAGERFLKRSLGALRRCRNAYLSAANPGIVRLNDCTPQGSAVSSTIDGYRQRLRNAIEEACRPTLAGFNPLGALNACADTVDGLVESPGGCLLQVYEDAMNSILEKEYGPNP
jgi:cysteine-rich repeat protein